MAASSSSKAARMEKGETFSGWSENGALAPGLAKAHPCLTGVEVARVARNKVSRGCHGSFYSQLGSRSILLVGCHRPRSTVRFQEVG